MDTGTDMTPKFVLSSTMPHGILFFLGAAFLAYGLTTPNPLETAWFVVVLLLLIRLWMWKLHPGIFLYLFLIQFIESHTSLMEANSFGVTLDELFPETGQKTWWLASFGLIAAMLGARMVISRGQGNQIPSFEYLRTEANKINQLRLLSSIFLAHGLASVFDRLIPYGSSLMQFETYVNGIPNALTLAFGIHFFLTRQRPLLVTLLFLYLLSTSFYSYFSSWRDPFILAFVSYLVSLQRMGTKELLRLSPLILPAVALVLVWQTVKTDYRAFLSGGVEDQAIRVTQSEAISRFAELASDAIDSEATTDNDIIESTYRRAGYIEYFSAAVKKVPDDIPFQQGKLLSESLNFALVPRILNPNKGTKNDREKVERFTDFRFGGVSSFSLGHYCEAYIDWGPRGMMVQLFLFGALGGMLYRITKRRTATMNPIIAFGIMWAVLFPWGTFQQDVITIAGKVFWGTLCQLLFFFPIHRAFHRFVTEPPPLD